VTGWFVSSSTGRAGSQCEEDEEGARIDDEVSRRRLRDMSKWWRRCARQY
jgi:hypothetical protein